MKAVRKKNKLTVLNKKVSIDPPEGYHWMEEKGRYYLMAGDYKPHPGAIAKASFKTVTHGKG